MCLPQLVPFPPASVKKDILPEEWELCVDSWLLLAQRYLALPAEAFAPKTAKESGLIGFLSSYVTDASASSDDYTQKSRRLRRVCFLLIHRTFTEVRPIPLPLFEWRFMAKLSTVYARSESLARLLQDVWHQEQLDQSALMLNSKATLTALLETADLTPELEGQITDSVALCRSCYSYGQFLMIGSDLIDAVSTAYNRHESPDLRKKLVVLAYLSLLSLMEPKHPKNSILLDHLYSLQQTSLFQSIIESTPFIGKIEKRLAGPERIRAAPLLQRFCAYARPNNTRTRKLPIRRKIDKGKSKARDDHGMHVHKLSLVTQIQDLFPDLGSGFIVKLLDEYNDDTEQVTAHLLDDSLPPHLANLNRTETLSPPPSSHQKQSPNDLAPKLAPHSTPPQPPPRRNIYDNDAFDNLTIPTSNLHRGRANPTQTTDTLLSFPQPSHKSAILSALAAFDSDDDERDDTYDAEDVGGTVDTTLDADTTTTPQAKIEEILFHAYSTAPHVLNRDADTRRSNARLALKAETQMTDEAIEGWAIMVSRDPKRLQRLERTYAPGAGGMQQQRALEGTAWRRDSGTEDSDAGGVGSRGRGGGGRGRGSGRGGGRGGRMGVVSGPADAQGTQAARRSKDAEKGSRANHNRRNQRARKMARGGFAG